MKGCTTAPALALCLTVAACASGPALPPPEPIIRTVEIKVPVQVPCPALEKLGAEPIYPDTDAALKAAANLFERVKLLMAGRVLRMARGAAVAAALASCGRIS